MIENGANKQAQVSDDTIARMLAVQAREQEIKAREIDIRHEELQTQAQYAHTVLQAQLSDRQNARAAEGKAQGRAFVLSIVVVLLLFFAFAYALHLGYAEPAFEVAKLLVATGVGGVGGYGLRAARGKAGGDSAAPKNA